MAESTQNQRPKRGPMGGHGPGGGHFHGEKAKDFKGTTKKLLKYMSRYKIGMIFVAIFAIASTVFTIIGPKILAGATTEIFEGLVRKVQGIGGIDFDAIAKVLITLLIIYAISAIFGYLQGFIMTNISQKISYKLRKQLAQKINKIPMKYYESHTHGEILSRITNDVDTLGMNLNQSITTLITSVATIIGILIMMYSMSPILATIIVIVLPISSLLTVIIVKKSQVHFKKQQEYLGHINGQVEEDFSGHLIIKAFGREEESVKEFSEKNKILYKSALMSQFLSGMMHPIMNFVGNLGYVAVVAIGAWLAIGGSISVGDIQAFIQYVRQFTQPIGQIAQNSSMLQSTIAAAERIFEFLEAPEEDQFVENPVKIDNLQGAVSFENVHFGYDPEKIIVNDFSAEVKAGQMVAIVGPTGAGKTTMVKLLMRFYDVNSGCLKIDGHNIQDFNRSELRELFGMVLQDTWLFGGTIMENIRYGKLDATDEEVYAAAKAAHVDHFIRTLPDGYNMELNEEGTNISGGQKQLFTIARAILANNPILILDEATSSVDTRTEVRIQKAMNNLMKGRTSFVIAHRLSTIKDADLILVMKDGDIIEQGNHAELMDKNGFYADLYNSQFDEETA